MTPYSSDTHCAEDFEDRMERAVFRAADLYDLDGETFFRSRDGRLESGSWEVVP